MAANSKKPCDISAAKEKVKQTITTEFGKNASKFLADAIKKLDKLTLIMRIEFENGTHTAWLTGIDATDPALAQGSRMTVMQALEQEHEGELLRKDTCARLMLPFLQIDTPYTTQNVSATAYGSMVPGVIKALDPILSAKPKSATFSVSVVNNYKRVCGAYKILLRNFTCSRNFRSDKERFGIVAMKHVQEQGICVPLSDVDQEDLECQLEEGDIEEILQEGLHVRQEAQCKAVIAQHEEEQREAVQAARAREQAGNQAKRVADAKVQAALAKLQLDGPSVWDRQKPPGWKVGLQIIAEFQDEGISEVSYSSTQSNEDTEVSQGDASEGGDQAAEGESDDKGLDFEDVDMFGELGIQLQEEEPPLQVDQTHPEEEKQRADDRPQQIDHLQSEDQSQQEAQRSNNENEMDELLNNPASFKDNVLTVSEDKTQLNWSRSPAQDANVPDQSLLIKNIIDLNTMQEEPNLIIDDNDELPVQPQKHSSSVAKTSVAQKRKAVDVVTSTSPAKKIRTSALYEVDLMSQARLLPQSRSTGIKRKAGDAPLSTEQAKKFRTDAVSAPTPITALVPIKPPVPMEVPVAKNLFAGPSYKDHVLSLWWDRKHVELRRLEEAGVEQAAEIICIPIANIDVERTGTRPLISAEVIAPEGYPSAQMTLFLKNYKWDSVELYYVNSAAAAVNVHYIMDRIQWLTSDEALITVGAPVEIKSEIKAEVQAEEVEKPKGKGKSKKKQQEQQLQQLLSPPISESGSPTPEQQVAHCPECKAIFSEASYFMQCYQRDNEKWSGISRDKIDEFLKKLKFTQLGRHSRAVAAKKHIILQWLNEHDFDKSANDLWLDHKNSTVYEQAQLLALGTRKAQPGVTLWGMGFAVQEYEMKLIQFRSLAPGTKIES